MRAMVIDRICSLKKESEPLSLRDMPKPDANSGKVLLEVAVCGVCHTEIDEIEGRTPPPRLPMIPGHQVVGRIADIGTGDHGLRAGQRVGVAWIHSACGKCSFCRSGAENLCPDFVATGRDAAGGYAEFMLADPAFVHPLPESMDDEAIAPLLCAGAIGYRSLRLSNITDGDALGLTGFGASGHLVLHMVKHKFPASEVFVFSRNAAEREHALSLGAAWAGSTEASPPRDLHAIIDTTPAWKPVRAALQRLRPGGRLVINAIRKEAGDQQELLKLDYARDLWMEREIKSVANVTRADVREMLELAAEAAIRPDLKTYPLEQANDALMAIVRGEGPRAKVLRIH